MAAHSASETGGAGGDKPLEGAPDGGVWGVDLGTESAVSPAGETTQFGQAAAKPSAGAAGWPPPHSRPPRPKKPRCNLMEILLDPHSIQILLALGGALMVTGLVVLLWVNQFLTPTVAAIGLGLLNAVALGSGWWSLLRTRYRLAGRALTLLACLVMPLNLWYYHANDLITLEGHLWAAAVVVSALYAISALALRDELFVYVFVGGVTLTGMLFLAGPAQRFWEIASLAALLVVLGSLSMHTERAFPQDEGPFSRGRFGLAFFWSGHALLAAGLLQVRGGNPSTSPWPCIFAEAAVFYLLASLWREGAWSVDACALASCCAVWQRLNYYEVASEYYTLAFALMGLALMIVYRLALLERYRAARTAETAFRSTNVLVSLAQVGGVFVGLSLLATSRLEHWHQVGLHAVMGLIALAAVWLVRHAAWRRWYLATAISQGALVFLGITAIGTLSPLQKLEIYSMVCGLLVLVVAHIGWLREQEEESDMVSLGLLLGSILLGAPPAIAALIDRHRGDSLLLNELGFLATAVLLLASGLLFRLKATTIAGTVLLSVYLLVLLSYVPWDRLSAVAVIITVGGGVLFGTGLVLSLFRERLLTLPQRIKERKGVFRVLDWR